MDANIHSAQLSSKNQRGATLVEFSIVFIVFLIVILAIIEFALVIFDASRLSEATRAATRLAIVNKPSCNILGKEAGDLDTGCNPGNHTLACGTNPADSVSVEISSCTFPATTPGCELVELMDQMMLRVDNSILDEGGSITITYTCSAAGAGENYLPLITVAAENIPHPMMFTSIFGFYSEAGSTMGPTITLPRFATTRSGEDMYIR